LATLKACDVIKLSQAFKRKRQIALSGRVWKYPETRECFVRQADGKTDRHSCAHKQQNMLCVAKQQMSDRGRMVADHECLSQLDGASVSEVLVSSGVRAMSPKN
jgi:hypothetical protein